MVRNAIVLGARDGSGNIGDVIAADLELNRFNVIRDHCATLADGGKFDVPVGVPYSMADVLVVSLGATFMRDFQYTTAEEIQSTVDACLTLPLKCAQRYVEARMEDGGSIIFIGSYAHRHPLTSSTAYCAAKAGIEMATKTLAWEVTELGFQVNCIHPYHVPGTPMWETVQEEVMRNKGMSRLEADEYAVREAKMPLARPGEIAETVKMLLNTDAMRWSSGTSIELYGGTR